MKDMLRAACMLATILRTLRGRVRKHSSATHAVILLCSPEWACISRLLPQSCSRLQLAAHCALRLSERCPTVHLQEAQFAGKAGWATTSYPDSSGGSDMTPLLDAIVSHVPAPQAQDNQPFALLATMIEHDNYVGRMATGRVAAGRVAEGDAVKLLPLAGSASSEVHKVSRVTCCIMRSCAHHSNCQAVHGRAAHELHIRCCLLWQTSCMSLEVFQMTELFRRQFADSRWPQQLSHVFAQVTRIVKRAGARGSHAQSAAHAGDIVTLSGVPGVAIGDTIAAPEVTQRLEPGTIDPPTLSMVFAPNSSPLGRVPGNVVTAAKITERLEAEAARSVSLRVRFAKVNVKVR